MSEIECLSRAKDKIKTEHIADGRIDGLGKRWVFTTPRRGMEIPVASVSSRKEAARKHAQPGKFLASLGQIEMSMAGPEHIASPMASFWQDRASVPWSLCPFAGL
jgi:hypothetical protein